MTTPPRYGGNVRSNSGLELGKGKHMIKTGLSGCDLDCSGAPQGESLFYVVDGVLTGRDGKVLVDGWLVIANLKNYRVEPLVRIPGKSGVGIKIGRAHV